MRADWEKTLNKRQILCSRKKHIIWET